MVDSQCKNIEAGTAVLNPTQSVNENSMPRDGVCLQLPVIGSDRRESVQPPPGFEGFVADGIVKEKTTRKKMVISKERKSAERRVTRSQKKMEKSSS